MPKDLQNIIKKSLVEVGPDVTEKDIVEFVEKICGVKLLEHQRELLLKIQHNPDKRMYMTYPPRHGISIFHEMYLEYLRKTKGE